jgi:hypothetical protein
VNGLLYSQIGYDTGSAKHALVRSSRVSNLRPQTRFSLVAQRGGAPAAEGELRHWGTLWDSHWWIADFSAVDAPGSYLLTAGDSLRSEPIDIGPHLLWDRTFELVALESPERRHRLAGRQGWFDCGSTLREVNSHCAMIIGLCDVLEFAATALSDEQRGRVAAQLAVGCNYLCDCQDEAARLGLGGGALLHELKHQRLVLPQDVAKASAALSRSARLLGARSPASAQYLDRAARAFAWVREAAPPGPQGFSATAHGVAADFAPPAEWMTCDLLMLLWAAVSLCRAGRREYADEARGLARRIMARQIPGERAEAGLWGHFRTFDSAGVSEKAWVHHDVGHDTGATFPHYLVPFAEMLGLWPSHSDAPAWRTTLESFAYRYFLPACNANPFGILPLGVFGEQGLIWFAGLWHGINAVYGHAAALALTFESLFDDRAFRPVAEANLQWIAGLNAGLTAESLCASHVWTTDVARDAALPVSQIHGVGGRFAGSWHNIRGSITNGFSTGDQFRFDVEPTRANDGPHTFTDEEWIVHSGGWLAGLARLRAVQAGCNIKELYSV